MAMLRPAALLLAAVVAPASPECPDNHCCPADVPEYTRLCSAVLRACVESTQQADPCACDADGRIPVLNASGGVASYVDTGQPGCAAHKKTYKNNGQEFCYVRADCRGAGSSPSVDQGPAVRWRPCVPHRACPAGCQAALDALLASPPIKGCVSNGATRHGLCPRLDLLERMASHTDPAAADAGPMRGTYFMALSYLRVWARARGCHVENLVDSAGVEIDGVFWSLRSIIATILLCCLTPLLVGVCCYCCGGCEALSSALRTLRKGSHPGRQLRGAGGGGGRGVLGGRKGGKYELVSSVDLDDDDEPP